MPIYESPLLTLGHILFTSTDRLADVGTRKKTENLLVRGYFAHWQSNVFACPDIEFIQTHQSLHSATGPSYDKTLNYDEMKLNVGNSC